MKIFLIGFMGCGKSFWGKQVSEKMNIPFYDLDEKIAEFEGQPVSEIFREKGEEYFREIEKEVLMQITESNKTFIMACGGGTPCFFNNIDYLKRNGIVAWINCSAECLYKRLIKEKDQRPLIKDISDKDLKSFIIKKYSGRKIFYQQANIQISEENLSMDHLIKLLFQS